MRGVRGGLVRAVLSTVLLVGCSGDDDATRDKSTNESGGRDAGPPPGPVREDDDQAMGARDGAAPQGTDDAERDDAGSARGGTSGTGGTAGSRGESDGGVGGEAGEGGVGGSGGFAGAPQGMGAQGAGASGGFPPIERVPVDVEASLDVLLVIDNSASMDQVQQLFIESLPSLLTPLSRVSDVRVAVISSSLGNHGLNDDTICPNQMHTNDAAHLVALSRDDRSLSMDSYEGFGFLWWDPNGTGIPAGESDIDVFANQLRRHVDAVGASGCGFEAPLEAAYRFLIDPSPYESLVRVSCVAGGSDTQCVAPDGVDEELLRQRAAFLRDDSALAVVFLTNDNDCSIRDRGQGYYIMRPDSPMPRGTAACDIDPNDACCQSCAAAVRDGCETNVALNGCEVVANPLETTQDQLSEAFNIRCFDQKRRFGMDMLYPMGRYTQAFTSLVIEDANGQVLDNPLFARGRPIETVFLAAIVGTPWQDVVVDLADPNGEVRTGDQLDWELLLPRSGNPLPLDPFNIEAMGVRNGSHPLSGDALAGPGSVNSINGHERELASGDGLTDDLQFACRFELPQPKDCSLASDPTSCECTRIEDDEGVVLDYATNNPLCHAVDGSYGTDQRYGPAHPAPRMYELVSTMARRGVLGSVCARETLDPTEPDYGYTPVFRALAKAMWLDTAP